MTRTKKSALERWTAETLPENVRPLKGPKLIKYGSVAEEDAMLERLPEQEKNRRVKMVLTNEEVEILLRRKILRRAPERARGYVEGEEHIDFTKHCFFRSVQYYG